MSRTVCVSRVRAAYDVHQNRPLGVVCSTCGDEDRCCSFIDVPLVVSATNRQASLVVLLRKEKQIWAIRGKNINTKDKNRKRPCLLQRKNEN
jgi:hypothetical protein